MKLKSLHIKKEKKKSKATKWHNGLATCQSIFFKKEKIDKHELSSLVISKLKEMKNKNKKQKICYNKGGKNIYGNRGGLEGSFEIMIILLLKLMGMKLFSLICIYLF